LKLEAGSSKPDAESGGLEELLAGPFGGRVLDVGSGEGSTLDPASSLPVAELRPRLVARVDAAPPPGGVQADLDTGGLPFVGGSFDAAACNHVLEHLRRPEALLAELARVLRPGAFLVAVVPNGWAFSEHLFRAWHALFPRPEPDHDRHVQRFTRRRLLEVLEAAGFEPLRVTEVGETYFWLRKHPLAQRFLTALNRRARPLHPPTFLYGWHVVARRRARARPGPAL